MVVQRQPVQRSKPAVTGDDPTVLEKPQFAEWLARRVEERAPTAVVRFGDGEESVLGARLDDAKSMEVATWKLDGETGLSFTPEEVLEVGDALAVTFDQADVLGILFSYQGTILDNQLVEGEMNGLTSLYLKRLASGRTPAALASSHLHQEIVDILPEMLAGRRVSVISCRDLKPVLEDEWGLEDVAVYQVPSQFSARDVDGAYEATMHDVAIWPSRHAEIQAGLTVRECGEVFLVGAGICGKDLCIRIRDLGGLAIDLGSALDRIVGKITRGPLRRVRYLHAQGKSLPEIIDDLEDRYGTDVNREKVRKLTEAGSPRWVHNPHDLSPLR
jgi:hypothetical protein